MLVTRDIKPLHLQISVHVQWVYRGVEPEIAGHENATHHNCGPSCRIWKCRMPLSGSDKRLRNFLHKPAQVSCVEFWYRFMQVLYEKLWQQTWLTSDNNDDRMMPAESQPIKPHNFGHYACKLCKFLARHGAAFYSVQETCRPTGKNLLKEACHCQTCTFLVQVDLYINFFVRVSWV